MGNRGFVKILLLFFLGILALGSALSFEVVRRLSAEGPLAEEAVIWIERGNGLETVTDKLSEREAIRSKKLFFLYGRATGLAGDLRAGEFMLPANASMHDIAETLRTAKPILHYVTIPEGRTVAQAFQIIEADPVLDGVISLKPEEGALLPETYSFHRGDSRDSVVEQMMAAHDVLLEELWPQRADDLPFETPEEAVILASIVEKETAVAEERPRVASVFVNRLRRRMRLQSDPTIIYGITGGEPLGRGIRQSELRGETPYNTYVIRGLPPTPIANPGAASIAAVLNPADTNDLYFVADGTGGHVFASTLREHNANVAAWRRIERARSQR
ncbi:MAG: endolytic transglycosylase MltG [Pseudomonadota bacterium]